MSAFTKMMREAIARTEHKKVKTQGIPGNRPKRSNKKVVVYYLGQRIYLPLRTDGTVIMPDGSVSHYKMLTPNMNPKN